ncbi:MAG TPA: hypothetical protein VMK12_18705 [Anaeromyxobacteraceae bacterium]|nr:hypothetical protein [Anaeromyxobacteraceae bacterium]
MQALIERELRRKMSAEAMKELPIYPEERLSTPDDRASVPLVQPR